MQKYPDELLRDIRRHLEEEKLRVTTRIQELTAQDPFADTGRLNDNAASDTEANEESGHERLSALIAQLTSQMQQIESAIARIANGTYGFCMNCHEMIDTDRLAILPTATLCLTCEKKKQR